MSLYLTWLSVFVAIIFVHPVPDRIRPIRSLSHPVGWIPLIVSVDDGSRGVEGGAGGCC